MMAIDPWDGDPSFTGKLSGVEVACPECRGARVMRYIDPVSMPPIRNVVDMDALATATYSAHEGPCRTCKGAGYVISTERIPVMQDGERIGTLPHDFNPRRVKSTNWLYDMREGDFRLEGGVWIAARTLGPGDLEAVPGFVWDRR